jgi:hypothetical protein
MLLRRRCIMPDWDERGIEDSPEEAVKRTCM